MARKQPNTTDFTTLRKKGDKSAPARNGDLHRDWWNREGEDACGIIQSTIETLFSAQTVRRRQEVVNARLYGNIALGGAAGTAFARMQALVPRSAERLTYNGVQENIDTIQARVGETKPRPYFLTNGGTYKQQRKAKKLNQFIDGVFYETKAYDIGLEGFRDGEIQGDGFVHSFGRGGKLHKERVAGSELWVDEVEAQYGFPRNMHRQRTVDRDALAAEFPESRKAIMAVNRTATPGAFNSNGSDMVTAVESWHRATLNEEGELVEGFHSVALIDGNHMLVEPEDWPFDFFPFARFSWCKRPGTGGFWSQSLSEQLQATQFELNKTLMLISKSMHLAGSFKVLMHAGSKIVKEHLNNDVGAVITFAGNVAPQYITVSPIDRAYIEHAMTLIERMRDLSGVTKMQTSGAKPGGDLSGKALRVLKDESGDRFKSIQRANDNFYMEICAIDVALANDMAKHGEFKPVRVPDKTCFQLIDWKKDIGDIETDEFVMQCFPVSALTGTPAENLQTIQEYVQAGFISPREARRALDFPDLQSIESLANAQEDMILKTLDDIIDDGVYAPPEPTDDLQMAKEMCLEHIQKYRALGLEEEKLDMLRTFNSQIDAMLAKSAQIQAAAAMPPPGAPQAVPSAPPVSQLLPNAPGAAA